MGEIEFTPLVITIIGTQGDTVVMLIAALIAMGWHVGRTPTHRDVNLENDGLRKNITQARDEVRNELKGEIRRAREEVRTELRTEIIQARDEVKLEVRGAREEVRNELKADIDTAKEEMQAGIRQSRDEVLDEIRRSHQQMMLALVNHSHRPDGQAVFTAPPDADLAPAPADN